MADVCSVARRYHTRLYCKTRIGSWLSLPIEIRLMILETIARQKHPGWASLASVCKEWQLVIAKENLRKLKLESSCLDDFGRVIIRQRDLVRHLWLNVELPSYTCRQCELRFAPRSRSKRDGSLIATAIWKLFSILSKWNPGNGLTLELNAFSPSDSDHWFKGFHFATDGEGDYEGNSETACPGWHDPPHGWVDGQRVEVPPSSAILRLFGTIDICFKEEVPRVDVITCFILRRQLRCRLQDRSIELILDKLGCLQQIIYEPWRVWERGWSPFVDVDYLRLLQETFPSSLKRLSVFEDFDENLAETLASTPTFTWYDVVEPRRIVNPRLGVAFASRSIDLEYLSVSYMANAEDFFGACKPSWTWQHLQALALTSQRLHSTKSREVVNCLLCKAAIAALQMPKLHTLVLWNGGRNNACAFIYQMDKGCPSITWRGTWDLELSSHVVKEWERVAFDHYSISLRIKKQRIHAHVASHGDAIHYLDLPCRVVEPASLWQIRKEGALPKA